jgi:anti-anti-sigma regulatory factor
MPPLELGPDLGIERAAELKEMLAGQVESGRSVVLDLSRAERIHSASLQLLTAFIRERQTAGRKTRIANPSAAFDDAAGVLALRSALGLSEPGDEA